MFYSSIYLKCSKFHFIIVYFCWWTNRQYPVPLFINYTLGLSIYKYVTISKYFFSEAETDFMIHHIIDKHFFSRQIVEISTSIIILLFKMNFLFRIRCLNIVGEVSKTCLKYNFVGLFFAELWRFTFVVMFTVWFYYLQRTWKAFGTFPHFLLFLKISAEK